MSLRWGKIGAKVWYGEDGSYRYTIEQRPFALGGTRFHVFRGGIASSDRFASGPSLNGMKRMAQQDATEREDRVLALPNYNAAAFARAR